LSDDDEPPEIFELIRDKFQADLAKTFGERAAEFNAPLKDLLFEFWTAATHSEIKVKPDPEEVMKIVREHFTGAGGLRINEQGFLEEQPELKETPQSLSIAENSYAPSPPIVGQGSLWVRNDASNVLMFTDDDGTDHPITGTGTPSPNVGEELQKLYENGDDPLQDALSAKSMPDAYMMVPVMMHKGTGQVFGVDLSSRNKYVPIQRVVHLTSNDGGWGWDFDIANQPPSHNDVNADHVIIRVDGEVQDSPSDYTVETTGYGTDEAVRAIRLMSPPPEGMEAEVTATFPDVHSDYF
jgi:hypothetical protein